MNRPPSRPLRPQRPLQQERAAGPEAAPGVLVPQGVADALARQSQKRASWGTEAMQKLGQGLSQLIHDSQVAASSSRDRNAVDHLFSGVEAIRNLALEIKRAEDEVTVARVAREARLQDAIARWVGGEFIGERRGPVAPPPFASSPNTSSGHASGPPVETGDFSTKTETLSQAGFDPYRAASNLGADQQENDAPSASDDDPEQAPLRGEHLRVVKFENGGGNAASPAEKDAGDEAHESENA